MPSVMLSRASVRNQLLASRPNGRRGALRVQPCRAMHTMSSASIQQALRQTFLLLGSGIFGLDDLVQRWEATDPEIRGDKDLVDAKRLQEEFYGYGYGNPSDRAMQIGEPSKPAALLPFPKNDI